MNKRAKERRITDVSMPPTPPTLPELQHNKLIKMIGHAMKRAREDLP
jgi:hypothetical protein